MVMAHEPFCFAWASRSSSRFKLMVCCPIFDISRKPRPPTIRPPAIAVRLCHAGTGVRFVGKAICSMPLCDLRPRFCTSQKDISAASSTVSKHSTAMDRLSYGPNIRSCRPVMCILKKVGWLSFIIHARE